MTKPRSKSYSYPPLRWREDGWEQIQLGEKFYAVIADESGDFFTAERLTKIGEKEWETPQEMDDPQCFIAADDNDFTLLVNATRCFSRLEDASVEASNLTLWRQYAKENERNVKMGKQWPHESVPEAGSLLPEKLFTCRVIDGEETETKNGKYQILFKTRVVEPKAHKNSPYRVAFIIGTDDDLEADESDTWTSSFAASRYKSFLKALDVPETGDIEEEIEACRGQTFVVDNGHSSDGKYNNPNAFYRVGEGDAVAEEKPAAKKSKPASEKPAKKAKVEEPADDDDWDD